MLEYVVTIYSMNQEFHTIGYVMQKQEVCPTYYIPFAPFIFNKSSACQLGKKNFQVKTHQ